MHCLGAKSTCNWSTDFAFSFSLFSLTFPGSRCSIAVLSFGFRYPFSHNDAINIKQKRRASLVSDVTDRQERPSPSATFRSFENLLCHSEI
ncbi:hypothetical protein TNCV_3855621 [Trichonephila clavipes]|nr:hypothetical protein TNCV_3855621 [Trichonephila clavipes]